MAKKPTTKKRTEVKELPRKTKKLTGKSMKKVKGGSNRPEESLSINFAKMQPDQGSTKYRGRS